jgi:hypothetical protein
MNEIMITDIVAGQSVYTLPESKAIVTRVMVKSADGGVMVNTIPSIDNTGKIHLYPTPEQNIKGGLVVEYVNFESAKLIPSGKATYFMEDKNE